MRQASTPRTDTYVLRALAVLVALVLLAGVAVTHRAGKDAARAGRDLRTAALAAGFTDVREVHVRYPFLIERLGLTARNEEPYPYGYASLDLELAGCWLKGVAASLVPDTRSWLPHPVSVRGVRFEYDYLAGSGAGSFRRVEFTGPAQLLARLGTGDGRLTAQAVLCSSRPADGSPGTGAPLSPTPAR